MNLWKRLPAMAVCAALCLGILAGCGKTEPQLKRYRMVWYDVFDTATTLQAYCASQEEFDKQAEALHADLVEYHKLYDIYHEYEGINNLCTVNANAGTAPVPVDDRILDMLEQAVQLHEVTDGTINIAMGSVLSIWHEVRAVADEQKESLGADAALNVPLPDPQLLAQAAEHTDIADLVIDRQAGTVYFADPELLLDVGSCGKGYACEMAARSAEARGLTSFSLSVGGNLRNAGVKPGDNEWTGGIQDPWQPDTNAFLQAVFVTDAALVTSGDYQRYFMQDGVRYHHLIDPDTLQPANYFRSVSILCGDSGLADCLSTGIFCMPLEEGMALIERLDGVEAYWCLPDGSTVQSSGWDDHTRK